MKNVSAVTDPATSRHRLTILDVDPLRARREARELFDALAETHAEAPSISPVHGPRTGISRVFPSRT
ncbi:hypothetical protein B9W68_05680 [Streptomyces sp. CS227]|uniref:hypothetical protein n=1 Tax=Streptomyces sp. CS227 TaxID=1982763 RepID=UPI000B40FE53|nr:hypothetical protein [Streptomyces sp. CS227]OWA18402.1 hypothetical protein B9W68_05680 [Streptomyces sp. CS227]